MSPPPGFLTVAKENKNKKTLEKRFSARGNETTKACFCGISMLTCLPNNLIANKKVEEAAKKYDAKEVKIKNLDKNA